MEIILQCRDAYGLAGWNGAVEIEPLRWFQLKRVAGSRDLPSLFRKLIKVFNSELSPLQLPKGLAVEDLDIGDFMQVLVAITAVSRARQVRKVYECPHCSKEQPRVIDILSVFIPKMPAIVGGMSEWELPDGTPVKASYVRVKDFLEIKEAVESIKTGSVDAAGRLDLTKVTARYGAIYSFYDQDDLSDFCDILDDAGVIALRTEIGAMTFDDKLKWIFNLQGDEQDQYRKLYKNMQDLSASMEDVYTSTCTNCNKEFTAKLEAVDYFFDFQWSSSSD